MASDTHDTLPAPDTARLIVSAGGDDIPEVLLGDELTIGHEADCDLRLTHRGVASRHARLHREGSSYVLTDLGSEEGVLIDGVYVAGTHRLHHGERITLGDAELVFMEPGRSPDEIAKLEEEAFLQSLSAGPARQRKPGIRLTTGGILLVMVALAVAVYLLLTRLPRQGQEALPTEALTQAPALTATSAAQVAAGSPTAEASPTPLQSPDDLLAQAEAFVQQSQFEEAVAIYEEYLTGEPTSARAEAGWAEALLLDGEPAQALDHAERAAALAPNNARALAILALACERAGYHRRALVWAERAVELDRANALVQAVRAEVCLADDRLEDAVAAAELALELDARCAEAHRIRGWLYYQQGQLGQAIGAMREAVDLQFDLGLRHYELGQLLIVAEDFQAAISSLMNAWVLRPKPGIAALLGEAYYGLEQYENARPLLEYALSEGVADAGILATLAAVEARSGRCGAARAHVQQALEREPEHRLALEVQEICQEAQATATPAAPAPTLGPATPTPLPSVGGRIAFPVWNTEQGQYDTYVARTDGSERQLIVEGMHQPAISPDGQWLAVNGERPDSLNLFIVRSDGSGLREITEHTEDELPEWSPDGQSLAFSSTRHGDKQSRVYIIDQVPFEWGRAQGRPLSYGADEVRGWSPAWVSRGQQSGAAVVYKGCDPFAGFATCGLFLISTLPGSQMPQQLTTHAGDSAPAVAGDRIAFMSDRDGNWEIYTVDTTGSDLVRVTDSAANDGLPAWAPDGRTIAFASDQGGVWAVWVVNPDGSGREKLFDIGGGGLAQDWQSEQIGWGP